MTGIPALFVLTLCVLIPPAAEDEKQDLICAKDFSAEVGEDVTLGCHHPTGRDVTDRSVYWQFNKKIYALVFKERKVSSAAQDQKFKGRASEDSSWNPAEGNLSMKISSVKSNESGTYTCSIRDLKMSCSTTLSIRPKSDGRSRAPDGDPVKEGAPLGNKGNTANNTGDTGSFIQVLCLIGFAIIGLIIIHSIRPFRNSGDFINKNDLAEIIKDHIVKIGIVTILAIILCIRGVVGGSIKDNIILIFESIILIIGAGIASIIGNIIANSIEITVGSLYIVLIGAIIGGILGGYNGGSGGGIIVGIIVGIKDLVIKMV
ncbi:uncharacterized protein ACO6RY_03118 [Pungitius sinensis]